MANTVSIIRTKFIDVRTGEESLGVRIYDDYDTTYNNLFESLPDDDLELLQMVMNDETDNSIYDWIRTDLEGISIDGIYYERSEFESALGGTE